MHIIIRTMLAFALSFAACHASAAVRRCISPEGVTIFTDRSCEHFEAEEVVPPKKREQEPLARPPLPDGELPLSSYGPVNADCARTPDALLFSLRTMLANRDINGLAGVYHWPGMGSYGARAVMDRLEALSAHSDGAADLVYPEAAFVVHDPQAYPGLPPEDPIGVSIPQYSANGYDPEARSSATLRIIRHAGCWWLHF